MQPMQPAPKDDLFAAVVNYNTAGLTRRCTRSLLDAGIANILVLDNASQAEDYGALDAAHAGDGAGVRVIRSEQNLGFAQGCNLLIEEALRDSRCARVLLVNSDAVVDAKGLGACVAAMVGGGHDLMGGRMLKPATTGAEAIDSLGIALYKCLLASNRKSTHDAYLGPTGGFAILSRRFLEQVSRTHGYVFDPSYFCYAEDTDLCVRARLLGTSVGYVDDVVAHHEGQASTTGGYSDFILYHGIRNSIWMAAKSIPGWVLVRHLPWFVFLHGGIIVRHTLQGHVGTLFRLYRDALRGLPRVLRERRAVQASRRVTNAEFRRCIDSRFYESRFLHGAIKDLVVR